MHRSRSASSSSVRCGCQYYQSNDPLPEKKSLIGTPPRSRTPTSSVMADHEYEPITPRDPPPPPILKVSEFSEAEKRPATPVPQHYERRYIKIPNEDAIIIPLHGDSDEEINPDRYIDKDLTVNEIKEYNADDTILNSTPTTIDTKMEDGEQTAVDVPENQKDIQSFQTSLKNRAGILKNKLKNISLPKQSSSEQPQPKVSSDRPKLKLPNRPKIKLPDRPKIKLPNRPKFLQERPKFLSERPKFLSERPKFLSQRPNFHLPDKAKFHLPHRPKFQLPERFKTEKSKGPRAKKPNPSSLRRPLRDVVTVSSQSGSTSNIFDTIKFKTYPRFLSRKKKEKERQLSVHGASFETESSLPSTPPSRKKKFNQPWVETYKDIKFADEDASVLDKSKHSRIEIQDEEGFEENTAPFHDSYLPGFVELKKEASKAKPESEGSANDSDKEIHSSGSSSMKHRAGVLEEIDSDEFFLREKGLSREDVDVSRYLSLEIRDAFRSTKNALAKLGTDMYDDEFDEGERPEIRFEEIPKPMERKKPSKYSFKSREPRESDFNTFPMRPSRRKQSDPSDLNRDDGMFDKIEKPPRKYRSKSDTRDGSMPSLRRSTSEGLTDQAEPPLPPKRRKGSRSNINHESATEFNAGDMLHEDEIVQGKYDIPVAPLRKSRSRGTSLAEEDRTSRGADSTDLPPDEVELQMEKEIIQEPLFQAKPLTVEESHLTAGYAVVMKKKKKPPPRPPPPPPSRQKKNHKFQSHFYNIKDHGMNFFFTYPRRAMKSFHKPPPVRPIRNYSTLGPSRPPRRSRVFREPVYVDSEEPLDKDELTKEITEMKNSKEEHDHEMKDLQSGEIVEKMKGRPLPPPPRPPRKPKDENTLLSASPANDELSNEQMEESKISDVTLKEGKSETLERYIKSKRDEFFNSFSKINPFNSERRKSDVKKPDQVTTYPTTETSQQTSFEVSEVSVSIQTDPLPEGYIVEDVPSELDAETISLRSRSTIGDSTRLDQKEEYKYEKETEVPTSVDICKQKIISSEDTEPTTKPSPSNEEVSRSREKEASPPPPPLPEKGISPASYTKSIPIMSVFPEKLHISELDVEKLKVTEFQASKVTAHDLETSTLNVTQINSKGGNLIVNGIELPSDFIQNLAAQIQERIQEPSTSSVQQPQVQELKRKMTPPPAIFVQHSESVVESSKPINSETTDKIPKPRTTKSKGRKSPTRIIDDSEDELAMIMPRRERKERESSVKREETRKSQDMSQRGSLSVSEAGTETAADVSPTAMQLIKELLMIFYRTLIEGSTSFIEGVNDLFPEGDKRRDAQTAACILLALVVGLIIIGFGIDNTVHHHHWDFVPPR